MNKCIECIHFMISEDPEQTCELGYEQGSKDCLFKYYGLEENNPFRIDNPANNLSEPSLNSTQNNPMIEPP